MEWKLGGINVGTNKVGARPGKGSNFTLASPTFVTLMKVFKADEGFQKGQS